MFDERTCGECGRADDFVTEEMDGGLPLHADCKARRLEAIEEAHKRHPVRYASECEACAALTT